MQLEFFGAAGEVTGSCHILRVAGRTAAARLRSDPGRTRRAGAQCSCVSVRCRAHRRGGAESRARGSLRTAAAAGEARLSAALSTRTRRVPTWCPSCCAIPPIWRCAKRSAPTAICRPACHASRFSISPMWKPTLRQLVTLPYDVVRELLPGISVRVRDAGHIMGSSSIEAWVSEGAVRRKLVFSGDLGQYDMPILKDPWRFEVCGCGADGKHLRQPPPSGPRRYRARTR